METKVAEFVRIVRERNVRETGAGLVVLFGFAAWLYWLPGPVVATLGKTIVLLGVVLVLSVIWGKLHIPQSELTAYPPDQYPERWRGHMTTQAKLLRWAWLWYVLPLLGGGGLTVLVPSPAPLTANRGVAEILGAFAVALAWLNIKAGRGIERDRDVWLGEPKRV